MEGSRLDCVYSTVQNWGRIMNIGDLVYRKEAPGKRGRICEQCPSTKRWRVQWTENRTWNREEFLIKVEEQ